MKDIPWTTCLRVGLTTLAVWLLCARWQAVMALLGRIAAAAAPLLWGGAIAYAVNLLLVRYEALLPKGLPLRRAVGILLSLSTLALLLAWLLGTLLPTLCTCLSALLRSLPDMLQGLLNHLEARYSLSRWLALSGADLGARVSSAVLPALEALGNTAAALLSGVLSVSASLGMALMFAVYLLAGKENLLRQTRRLVRLLPGRDTGARVMHVAAVVDRSLRRYITGQCTEAVLLGGLCWLGMRLCRFALSGPIAVLAGFSALLPVAGPPLAAIASAALLLAVQPEQIPMFLVFFLLLQQVEGSIIYPRVVGASIGLSGCQVLAAATVLGTLTGPAGMLLGVPLASAVRELAADWLRRQEGRRP